MSDTPAVVIRASRRATRTFSALLEGITALSGAALARRRFRARLR